MKKVLFLIPMILSGLLFAAGVTMSADAFLSKRAKNTVVFDDTNVGKRFEISGEIYAIEKSTKENEKPSVMYMVEITGQNIMGKSLRLFFNDKKDISLLETEQQITADCIYKGITERGLAAPSFYNCTIIAK